MPTRILVAIALGLIFFQLAFSVFYSGKIVSYNQTYSKLEKKYTDTKFENESLEIEYAQKNAINKIESF